MERELTQTGIPPVTPIDMPFAPSFPLRSPYVDKVAEACCRQYMAGQLVPANKVTLVEYSLAVNPVSGANQLTHRMIFVARVPKIGMEHWLVTMTSLQPENVVPNDDGIVLPTNFYVRDLTRNQWRHVFEFDMSAKENSLLGLGGRGPDHEESFPDPPKMTFTDRMMFHPSEVDLTR